MTQDYFTILGLAPGRYSASEVARSFQAQRERLLVVLDDPRLHADTRQQLEKLHVAFAMLRDPESQAAYLETRFEDDDDLTHMRRLIAASLENGLMRFSRRQQILSEGRRRGLSDFQTQLLIAQIQFGDERIVAPVSADTPRAVAGPGTSRAWARLAAVAVLALAIFLAMMRWLAT